MKMTHSCKCSWNDTDPCRSAIYEVTPNFYRLHSPKPFSAIQIAMVYTIAKVNKEEFSLVDFNPLQVVWETCINYIRLSVLSFRGGKRFAKICTSNVLWNCKNVCIRSLTYFLKGYEICSLGRIRNKCRDNVWPHGCSWKKCTGILHRKQECRGSS